MAIDKNTIKQMLIVLISSSLSACAAAPSEPGNDSNAMKSPGSDCISQSTIRDYTVLDDSNLIVSASGRRKYHLALYRRAYGLRSSWQIGLESSSGQVCAGFGDLLYDDGFAADRVRIASIRRLGPEEEEELLIRFGKKKPVYEQAPAPTPVEGAEVEELD
jgi:hypothetical protein